MHVSSRRARWLGRDGALFLSLSLWLMACASEHARLAGSGSLGDRCANDDDCRAGYCLDVGGTRVCTEPCKRDRDCPAARNWWCGAPREIETPVCLCRASARQVCGDDVDRNCDGELDPCSAGTDTVEETSLNPILTVDAGTPPVVIGNGGRDAASNNLGPSGAGGLDAGRADAGGWDAALDASARDAAPLDAASPDANRGGSDLDSGNDGGGPGAPDADAGAARLEDEVSVAMVGPYRSESYQGPANALYGAATIYYPTGHRSGASVRLPFALVALIPDFLETQSDLLWAGQTLASHGFAAVVVGPPDDSGLVDVRAAALAAGLQLLEGENQRADGPLRGQLDVSRAALLGYGVGGGAVLQMLEQGAPYTRCAVLWEPWGASYRLAGDRTPTLFLTVDADVIAPSADAWLLYQAIPNTTSKLYVERTGDHLTAIAEGSARDAHVAWSVAFLKRYLEDDVRYEALLANPGMLVHYDRRP